MTKCFLPLVMAAMIGAAPAAGQPAQPPAETPPPAADPQAPPTPPPNYTYSAQGRRDPFLNLVNRGVTDARSAPGRRPDGVAGLAVNELVVRGILQSQGGYVAMVQAPNGRTYTVRQGDQLWDGRVRAITAEALILTQDVNDPLSVEKQREVRKPLRGGQEGY
jgi:Tfp pilus assembly protein PilP